MKTKIYMLMTIMTLIAIAALIWMQSCKKSVDILEPDELNSTIDLNGEICDPVTYEPLKDVSIEVLENDKLVKSNENGDYLIEGLSPGNYTLVVQAKGRITAISQIQVLSFISSVNTVFLPEINNPALIQMSGGSITEILEDGRSFIIEVPAQALSSPTNISITPMEGIVLGKFPGDQSSSKVPVGTVEITNHSNNGFQSPLFITFDLPFRTTGNSKLPVLEFDFNNCKNEETGTYAIVDQNGLKATFQIEHPGRYSVLSDKSIQQLNLHFTENITLWKDTVVDAYDGMILKTKVSIDVETLFPNISNMPYSYLFTRKLIERIIEMPLNTDYNYFSTIIQSRIGSDLINKSSAACGCTNPVVIVWGKIITECEVGVPRTRVISNGTGYCEHGTKLSILIVEYYCDHDQGLLE